MKTKTEQTTRTTYPFHYDVPRHPMRMVTYPSLPLRVENTSEYPSPYGADTSAWD